MTTSTDPTLPTIPVFTAASGWSTAPSPMPEGQPSEDYGHTLHEAGWSHIDSFPCNYGVNTLDLELREHDEHGFAATVWHGGTGTTVLLPELPDFLAFLSYTLPIVEAAARLDDRGERQRKIERENREAGERQRRHRA